MSKQGWERDQDWVYGDECGSLVFVPEWFADAYNHDRAIQLQSKTIGEWLRRRSAIQVLWDSPDEVDAEGNGLSKDSPFDWDEYHGAEEPRLAHYMFDRWNWLDEVGDIAAPAGPYSGFDEEFEDQLVERLDGLGYRLRRVPSLGAG